MIVDLVASVDSCVVTDREVAVRALAARGHLARTLGSVDRIVASRRSYIGSRKTTEGTRLSRSAHIS